MLAAHETLPFRPDTPWLAPLAGYSDLAFRLLCREHGAAAACTEMVSAKGLVLGQGGKAGATESLLATIPAPGEAQASGDRDLPLVVQLFGAEPACMGKATALLVDRGYVWFDCNMGCAAPKVMRIGAGAALLQDVETALDVGRAMIQAAGEGRVGFKLRLGRQAGEEVWLALARGLEEAGAGWITLHPRYARQGFSGTADWTALARLKAALSIPVLASGDLHTAEDAVRCLRESGVDAVMFARGALADPMVFRRYGRLLAGLDDAAPSAAELYALIRRHIDLVRRYAPPRWNRQGIEAGLLAMRAVIPRYCRRIPGARALRAALIATHTWEEAECALEAFFSVEHPPLERV